MNEAMLRGLTDEEFLRYIQPVTQLEIMLAERLAAPQVTLKELEQLRGELSDAQFSAEEHEEAADEAKEHIKEMRSAWKALKELMEDE